MFVGSAPPLYNDTLNGISYIVSICFYVLYTRK